MQAYNLTEGEKSSSVFLCRIIPATGEYYLNERKEMIACCPASYCTHLAFTVCTPSGKKGQANLPTYFSHDTSSCARLTNF